MCKKAGADLVRTITSLEIVYTLRRADIAVLCTGLKNTHVLFV